MRPRAHGFHRRLLASTGLQQHGAAAAGGGGRSIQTGFDGLDHAQHREHAELPHTGEAGRASAQAAAATEHAPPGGGQQAAQDAHLAAKSAVASSASAARRTSTAMVAGRLDSKRTGGVLGPACDRMAGQGRVGGGELAIGGRREGSRQGGGAAALPRLVGCGQRDAGSSLRIGASRRRVASALGAQGRVGSPTQPQTACGQLPADSIDAEALQGCPMKPAGGQTGTRARLYLVDQARCSPFRACRSADPTQSAPPASSSGGSSARSPGGLRTLGGGAGRLVRRLQRL